MRRTIFLLIPYTQEWSQCRASIDLPPGVCIVGDTDSPKDGLAQAAHLKPSTIVIATHLAGGDTVALVAALRGLLPKASLIVVSEEPTWAEYLAYPPYCISAFLGRDDLATPTFRRSLALKPGACAVLVSRTVQQPIPSEQVPPLKVLIAEPGDIVREGLHALLSEDAAFKISEVKTNFISAAQRLQPDLIMFDPCRHATFDAELVASLHRASPNSRLVGPSDTFEPHVFLQLMQEKVQVYSSLGAHVTGASLKDALRLAGRYGWVVVDGASANYFWEHLHQKITVRAPDPTVAPLNEREYDTIVMVAAGATSKDIARHLFISERTVESIIDHVSKRLGANNRAHLVALCYKQGLIDL